MQDATRDWQLLAALADGCFHSGVVLAGQLGVTRATISNLVQRWSLRGVRIHRVRGRGYRLQTAWQPLSSTAVEAALGEARAPWQVEVRPELDSTNSILLAQAAAGAAHGRVLTAEWQTAGRGRRGRTWHSAPGQALTFSLLWRTPAGLNALSGMSLAVGVAIVRVLRAAGAQDAGLKWPNDLVCAQGKLGGILIEAQGDVLGPSALVIGVGLNLRLTPEMRQQIEQPVAALEELMPTVPERNALLAALLRELEAVLGEFGRAGFAVFSAEWARYHRAQNCALTLNLPDGSVVGGIARGVNARGELELEMGDMRCCFGSGEVGEAG